MGTSSPDASSQKLPPLPDSGEQVWGSENTARFTVGHRHAEFMVFGSLGPGPVCICIQVAAAPGRAVMGVTPCLPRQAQNHEAVWPCPSLQHSAGMATPSVFTLSRGLCAIH